MMVNIHCTVVINNNVITLHYALIKDIQNDISSVLNIITYMY